MRVIAGTAGGRRLATLSGLNTRPTADRVKEAMFSVLSEKIAGAVVLDAFAGSGALALEALSRGADTAWLVEKDRAAAKICEKNIAALGFANCRLLTGDVLTLLPRLSAGGQPIRFDLVFADPPYAEGLLMPLLDCLLAGNWLATDAVVVAESASADGPLMPGSQWITVKSSVYGSAMLTYLKQK